MRAVSVDDSNRRPPITVFKGRKVHPEVELQNRLRLLNHS